jgi:hypothetical protein
MGCELLANLEIAISHVITNHAYVIGAKIENATNKAQVNILSR